jgi:NitT/TauT family transport system permease protein
LAIASNAGLGPKPALNAARPRPVAEAAAPMRSRSDSSPPIDSVEQRPPRAGIAAPRRTFRLPAAWKAAVWPVLVFLVFIAAWSAATVYSRLPPSTLPSPNDVMAALVGQRAALAAHAVHTTLEALAGFALAASLGIGIGLAMNSSRWLREMLYPNLVALQVIPKIALAPVFIVWFGIGFESKLLLATFISFFPVAIGTATGLMETDAGALKLCRALGATRRQTLLQVRLPYALPFVFSGLKVASTMAMIGVVVGEFISSQRGLGYFILNASSRIDTPSVIAAIGVLCIAGMGLYAMTDLLERAARKRWWPQ